MNPRPKRWQRFALPLTYSHLLKKDYKTTIFYKQEFEKSSEFRERLRLTIALGLIVGGALVEQFMILRQDY